MAASLQQIRRALCAQLGASRTLDLTTTSTAVPLDSVISTTLAETLYDSSGLDNTYVYIVDGAQAITQRPIAANSLNVTTGAFSVARAWAAAIQTGVNFELHKLVPPLPTNDLPGLHVAINEALRHLWVLDRIPFPGISNALSYAIDRDTYPWWTEGWRVAQIYDPALYTGGNLVPSRHRWRWRRDIQVCAIEFLDLAPYSTGDIWWVDVYRPANSILRTIGNDPTGAASVQIAVTAAQPLLNTPVANATAAYTVEGATGLSFQVSGTYGAATIVGDTSADGGTTWTNVTTIDVTQVDLRTTSTAVASQALAANTGYVVYVPCATTDNRVRLRCTVFTTGSIAILAAPGAGDTATAGWNATSEGWANQPSLDAKLTAELQESPAELSDVVTVALALVYQQLLTRGPDGDVGRWQALWQEWTQRAGALEQARRPQPDPRLPSLDPMVPSGTRTLAATPLGAQALR